ncbi:MAG: MBL fold metallo-hydrolase [Clostridia bacterium]|nr:MBL fold metallo-hydrolase [Clostridia bacterium]
MKRLLLILVSMLLLVGCSLVDEVINELYPTSSEPPAASVSPDSVAETAVPTAHALEVTGELTVYIIDVGQGDSILLQSPNGKTMLVDAGTSDSYESISTLISELGIQRLDVVVATHPHADHIGCMDKIIENYEIGAFYMTDFVSTSKTYERMITALENADMPVYQTTSNTVISWDDSVNIKVLSPIDGQSYDDSNNSSIVMKVSFGSSSILLTGDAESDTESRMREFWTSSDLQATVLKLGHHGSSTSTSSGFLTAVNPAIAVCSLGADNSYGHPHDETLALLSERGIPLYRTDELGTIKIILDGSVASVLE